MKGQRLGVQFIRAAVQDAADAIQGLGSATRRPGLFVYGSAT